MPTPLPTRTRRRKASSAARQQAVLQRLLRKHLAKLTKVLAAELRPAFAILGERAERSFLLHVDDSFEKAEWGRTITERFIYLDAHSGKQIEEAIVLKASDANLVKQIMDDLKLREWSDMHLKQSIQRHWVRTGGSTVEAINKTTDLGVMLPAPAERRVLEKGGTRAGLVDIEKDSRRAILKAIADGRANGEGAKAIAQRLRQYVPAGRYTQLAKVKLPDGSNAGTAYRSRMIARAESKTAQNYSSLLAYQDHPNVEKVQAWDAQIGDEHDPYCEERNQQIFTVEEAMQEDLTQPNCSLSWSPVVE